MRDVLVCCKLGGAANNPADIATARQQLHDSLIEKNPVRLGPVSWLVFPRDAAADVIAEVASSPSDYDGLAAWLAAEDDAVLIVAMVDVPAGARA